MNATEIEKLIREKILKTTTEIYELKQMTQPVAPDNAIGRLTRMDAINNKTVFDAALRMAEQRLKGLEHALSKVHSSDFGICIKCKSEIPIGRILLKPESLYCVKCAK